MVNERSLPALAVFSENTHFAFFFFFFLNDYPQKVLASSVESPDYFTFALCVSSPFGIYLRELY